MYPPRKKSILFVNQHYYPDTAATAQQLTDLAEYLVTCGHKVSVLCSNGHYLSGAMHRPRREVHNGVSINRVRATSFGRRTFAGRLADYGSFVLQALPHILFGQRHDYVVLLTTPPLLSIAGTLSRLLRGQKYGIWSMDLHPDAEEALGMLRGKRVMARMLHGLSNAGYRYADFIVVLGRYMEHRILGKRIDPRRLHVIPVWARNDEFESVPKVENPLLAQLGLQNKFVVMYSGSAGLAHRFDEVLASMRDLKDHPAMYFLFVGSGPQKDNILSFARTHHITNFRYLDPYPREQIKYVLSLADVHLLTLKNEMAGISVPCKLYGIMAAGRPVVMVGPRASEPGMTIEQEAIGVVIDPLYANGTSARKLSDVLVQLYKDTALRKAVGEQSRKAFLDKYEQQIACGAWARMMEQA